MPKQATGVEEAVRGEKISPRTAGSKVINIEMFQCSVLRLLRPMPVAHKITALSGCPPAVSVF
jgi:hypothetical protein